MKVNTKERPEKLDDRYGWCNKPGHGTFLDKEIGCRRCKREEHRKEKRQCCALLHHGPGHQSETYCDVIGPHSVHSCRYGCHDELATWTGDEKSTGFFDEPPTVEE